MRPGLRRNAVWSALRDERGLTVIEVLVAAIILVIGSLAVLTLVDATARSTFRAEQGQVVSNRLQQEVELIKQLPYEQIALTSMPAASSDPKSPGWRVEGGSYAVDNQGTDLKPLVVNGGALYEGGSVEGGAVSAAPAEFQDGDIRGTVHRYVVWSNDDSCPESHCPGAQDSKIVIVAIKLDTTASGGERGYQEVQAQIADPEAEPVQNANPLPPGDDETTPWTLWLTDTPCSSDQREPIAGDHTTHNTRGECPDGVQAGNNPGAPDLLFDAAPIFNPENPIFDYATDLEPLENPEADKGLQVLKGTANGCSDFEALQIKDEPDAEPTTYQRIHKWLTPPMPSGTDLLLDGDGTVNLWMRTVNGTSHAGSICVWLFVRQPTLEGSLVDTAALNQDGPLVNATHFALTENLWPSDWTEIVLPINFNLSTHLTEGRRLGLAVAVERQGTAGDGLELMYDEPSFDSRLELQTHSQVPTF